MSSSKAPQSARADTSSRKRPAVDLSLVDARLDELFAAPIADADEVSARADRQVKSGGTFQMLTHDQITVRPQVRVSFPADEIAELGASIRELRANNGGIEGSGILQALLVTPEGDGFRLVAGERRFRASQEQGVPLLPCVSVPYVSESAIRLLQLTENALRTPPPTLEEARAIRETMDEEKLSIRDVARLLGKDKSYIEVRVNLLKYPIDVQEMVSARADTLRHARHLAVIKEEDLRASLVIAVRDEGIGEREVKRRIEAALNSQIENLSLPSGKSKVADKRAKTTKRDDEKPPAQQSISSQAPFLEGALKVVADAVERLQHAALSGVERQKALEERETLRALVAKLDEILG